LQTNGTALQGAQLSLSKMFHQHYCRRARAADKELPRLWEMEALVEEPQDE
jgi:hypothetical protein